MELKRAYKTEITFDADRRQRFAQSVGTCRFLYNRMIADNKKRYEDYLANQSKTELVLAKPKFLSDFDYDKYVLQLVRARELRLGLTNSDMLL